MPSKEKQAEYNATKPKAKRKKKRFEAMPEAQALRAELGALQRGIAGERPTAAQAPGRPGSERGGEGGQSAEA